MREYNYGTVYDSFNNTFPVDGVIPYLNLPPLPLMIFPVYVTSGNSISMFTVPYDSPQLLVMYYDDSDTKNTTMKNKPFHISKKLGYCSKFHKDNIG